MLMTDLSAPPLRDEIYVTLEHQALDQTVSQFRGVTQFRGGDGW